MAKALLEHLWTERKESVLIALDLIKCYYKEEKSNETQSDTVTIQAKLDKANSRLTNLIAMRADGEISKDEYQAMRSPVDEEIKKLQKALDEIPQEKSNPKGLDIEGIRSTLNSLVDFSGSTISHDVVNRFVYLITPTSDTTFDWYVNLNGTADVKATFTAEGRKKNCIIKLEEIEKISSVHRGENEDNAHFIKNPHIFTYLHNQHAAEHYIDVAQEYGLAGDVCPMPEAEAGVSIDDDAPVLGACAVQCNTTCDGSLLGNGVISKRLELEDGIPVFQLAAPLRHREDDVQDYAAQEIKNAIAFIEEHTGEKWDWKAYFECAERVNYATKCRLEWLEMNKTDYPQVFGSNLALYTETNYMAICGKVPAFREVDRKITQLAERAYRKQKKAANEYRHRAIVWGVQSHFYMDFLVWLLNCWGIVPLTDMLSMVSTRELATTDTPENREQAYYDMAWLTENMIMRNRTHGGYKVLLDELWEFCEQFNADMVILWEHMSCKALDGMHGLFEERAREHGIHLVWVTHDLFDPRVISRQGVRQQVNDYMRTVMQEEPVDPSLEILKDEKSW